MIRKYLELNAESDSFVGLGKVYRRTVWVREAYGRVVVVVAAEWIVTRHQRTWEIGLGYRRRVPQLV